jgi:DNA-binding phage protein
VNITELRVEMIRAGKNIEDIAQELGVTPSTLYRKMDGKSDFYLNELKTIKKVLNLSFDDMKRLFFVEELDKTQEAEK